MLKLCFFFLLTAKAFTPRGIKIQELMSKILGEGMDKFTLINGEKYYFNQKNQVFYKPRTNEKAPPSVQRYPKDKEFKKSLDKAIYYLNGGTE